MKVDSADNKTARIGKEQYFEILVFSVLCLFMISPLVQTVREFIAPHKETPFGPLRTYPNTIGIINVLAAIVAILLWGLLLLHVKREWQQGRKPKVFLPLAVFGALALWIYISQTVNGFTEIAYVGDNYRSESLFTFILYLIGYFFLGIVLQSDRLRKALCIVFLGTNLIIGILSLIDHYISPLTVFSDSDGMAAIFNQFNHYGYYLVLAILISAVLFIAAGEPIWLRVFCAVVFVTDNVILILNNTFGCYLAVIAALVFGTAVVIIGRRNRGEIIRALIVCGAFVVITVSMHLLNHSASKDVTKLVDDIGKIAADDEKAKYAGTGRWSLWTHTVEYIKVKPVFGWGVEGTSEMLQIETKGINSRPHNEYLQWAAFFGIPATLLYFAALCLVMFGMFPRVRKADAVSLACFVAAAGYIASSFVGNTMYYTTPFFIIFLGMTCRDRYYKKRNDAELERK